MQFRQVSLSTELIIVLFLTEASICASGNRRDDYYSRYLKLLPVHVGQISGIKKRIEEKTRKRETEREKKEDRERERKRESIQCIQSSMYGW